MILTVAAAASQNGAVVAANRNRPKTMAFFMGKFTWFTPVALQVIVCNFGHHAKGGASAP
jgi:hypothetical protein